MPCWHTSAVTNGSCGAIVRAGCTGCVAADAEQVGGDLGEVADHGIGAPAAFDGVVAGLAVELVVATVAGDVVVAVGAVGGLTLHHLDVAADDVERGAVGPRAGLVGARPLDPAVVADRRVLVTERCRRPLSPWIVSAPSSSAAPRPSRASSRSCRRWRSRRRRCRPRRAAGAVGAVAEDQVVAVVALDLVVAVAAEDDVTEPLAGVSSSSSTAAGQPVEVRRCLAAVPTKSLLRPSAGSVCVAGWAPLPWPKMRSSPSSPCSRSPPLVVGEIAGPPAVWTSNSSIGARPNVGRSGRCG